MILATVWGDGNHRRSKFHLIGFTVFVLLVSKLIALALGQVSTELTVEIE